MTIDITPKTILRMATGFEFDGDKATATTLRALSAALTASQAETAAAYEAAAETYVKGDWDWFSDADDAIRALPTTFTNAELLAAAMQLPEVRALVEAADAMKTQLVRASYESVNMYTGKTERHFGVFGETWLWFCAAIAPFTKGGE